MSNPTSAPLFINALFPLNFTAVSPSMNFMPCFSRCACITAAHSLSSIEESTLSARSHTVTEPTRPMMPSAHFSPIRPAPTISTRLSFVSAFSSARLSSRVIKVKCFFTVSSPSNFGTKGDEPVQMHSLSNVFFCLSASVTVRFFGSSFSALPKISFTPFFS